MCLFVWTASFVFSQEVAVESFYVAESDLSAAANQRFDLNERPCALVKVQLTMDEASFDGNVIGDVEYKTGEYWVYMSEGSKRLKVMHNKFVPLEVEFEEYEIRSLQSKYTYVLKIRVPYNIQPREAREADVHGVYKLMIGENENITLRDARLKCLELAKAEAIKAEFGEMITSDVIQGDENDGDLYYENTLAKAQGEWLGDVQSPQIQVEYADGKLFFTAEVWGKAREIVQAKIDLDWKILRGEEGENETAEFNNRDRIRIKFKSPADGYVAVYLIEEGDETSCLLPYKQQTTGQFKVFAGREYTFFDRESDPMAVPYALATKHEIEKNQLVIIYSPNAFTKCNDTKGDPRRPNMLSSHNFQKWLLNCQRTDKDMVVNKKWVTIRKENN